MKSRVGEGMRLVSLGCQEKLFEDMTFMLKIQVIPGKENNTSEGVKAGKHTDVL